MVLLFFLISFVYNLLRALKISLVVKVGDAGAEIIPFLKIGAVLPAALLFTYLFTKLASKYTREKVFYIIVGSFLVYFALFLCVLYPFADVLQFDSGARFLQQLFAHQGFAGLVDVVRYWNLSLFYVLSEMWSSVVLSLLFWGFANEVTKVNEAKRFYAIFALAANSSGMFCGLLSKIIAKIPIFPWLFFDGGSQWMFYQLLVVLVSGIVIMCVFRWLNLYVFAEENLTNYVTVKNKKSQISLSECFSYLMKSRYLLYIVIIVTCYNIVYNLSDVVWTYKVEQTYSDSASMNAYLNRVAFTTAFVAVVFAFMLSGNLIRAYGWTVTAIVSPLLWLVTSSCFFSGLLFEDFLFAGLSMIGNPANLVLFAGTVQICLGRSCKYTLFDETKEIAFIPLSKENQRRGKAVVDGIASRFGKSGGSLIYIVLFLLCGGITASVPYVSAIVLLSICFWLYAVYNLGRMVENSIDLEMHDKGLLGSETNA